MRARGLALRVCLLLVVFATLLITATVSRAKDERSWDWTSWNVDISNFDFAANRFHVKEVHTIRVTEGSFAGGDRGVYLDRVTGIENVTVRDGSTSLQQKTARDSDQCGLTPGIFCVLNDGAQSDIWYNFTARTYAGESRTMTIEYDVLGALRSYPDFDQFFWSPLASDRDFNVLRSTVRVILPTGTRIQNTTMPDGWTMDVSGSTLTFKSDPGNIIGTGTRVEIGVAYPHVAAMAAPKWQAGFETEKARSPLYSLLLMVVSGVIAVGGSIWVFLRYATKGRDPEAVVVPEYLTEPPSEQPPGVAGTLIDESADMQDIIATLVDLARRGFIVIEHQDRQGLFGSEDFIFHRTDKSHNDGTDPLRNYEYRLLTGIFGGLESRKLSDLKNKFYTQVSPLKSELYQEVLKAGYFKSSPEQTRTGWYFLGGFLTLVGGGAAVAALSSIKFDPALPYKSFFALPCAALALVGIVILFFARLMVARTPLGSQETAKWKAFKHYLANIKKYSDVNQSQAQFERYIGYAVAFGLGDQWIHSFQNALTSMPTWYYWPHYYGGRPYQRGWVNTANPFGGSAGGLNDMSRNMTEGLNNMSKGLTDLLNSASKTMSSSPSSSSSGGGFSGGGSSGGGHAGGH